jgi:hypothetical protein
MFVATVRPRYYLISLAVSVGIFLLLYFTVIKPDNNAANNALRQAGQQVSTTLNQAAQQDRAAGAPASITNLTSCVAAAGTDVTKLQACKVKFQATTP